MVSCLLGSIPESRLFDVVPFPFPRSCHSHLFLYGCFLGVFLLSGSDMSHCCKLYYWYHLPIEVCSLHHGVDDHDGQCGGIRRGLAPNVHVVAAPLMGNFREATPCTNEFRRICRIFQGNGQGPVGSGRGLVLFH